MHLHFLIIAIFGIIQVYGKFITNNELTNNQGPNTAVTNNVDGNQDFLNNIITNNNCGVCPPRRPTVNPKGPEFHNPPRPTFSDPPRTTFPDMPRPTFPDLPSRTFPEPRRPTFPEPPSRTFPEPTFPEPTFPEPPTSTFHGPPRPKLPDLPKLTFPAPSKKPCDGFNCKLCNIDFPELSPNPTKPWITPSRPSNGPNDNGQLRPRPRPESCPIEPDDKKRVQPQKNKSQGLLGLILSLL